MKWLLAVLVIGGLARPANADSETQALWRHGGLTLGLWGLYAVSELPLKHTLAPTQCHWCSPLPFDRPVRNALVWRQPERAGSLSNITGFALLPASSLGLLALGAHRANRSGRVMLADAITVLEAGASAALVTQVIKFSVARQRPLAYFGAPTRQPDNYDHVSFLSGHTSFTVAMVAAAGTVASMRGYRYGAWIWGVGGTLALSTAYLRIGADKHYLSDVSAGAGLGLAIGLIVPHLVRRDLQLQPQSTSEAHMLSVAGAF